MTQAINQTQTPAVVTPAEVAATPPASQWSTTKKVVVCALAILIVAGAMGAAIFFTGGAASPIIAWAPSAVPVVMTAIETVAEIALPAFVFGAAAGTAVSAIAYMIYSAVTMMRKTKEAATATISTNPLMTDATKIVALALDGTRKNKNAILNVRKGATVDEINEAAKKLLKKFTATKAMSPSDKEVIEMARKAITQARDLYLAKRKRTPPPLRERAATI